MLHDLLNWLSGVTFEANDGAGQGSAGGNSESGGGQAPAQHPARDGQTPAPAPAPGENAPQLVDVTATNDAGELLWFPRSEVVKLRQEAASLRAKLKTQAEPAPDDPPAPPAPNPQVDTLTHEVRTLRIHNAVLAEAARTTADRAAFIDPEDAVRLADLTAISLAEDGTIQGVKEAITALATSKPHLLATARPAAPARADNPPRQEPLTLAEIQAMTPAQINARREEVNQALATAYARQP